MQGICSTLCDTILRPTFTILQVICAKGMRSSNPNQEASAHLGMCLFSVFDGMTELCKTYFPCEPKRAQEELQDSRFHQPSMYRDGPYDVGEDEQEQEEEREEEEKDAGAK